MVIKKRVKKVRTNSDTKSFTQAFRCLDQWESAMPSGQMILSELKSRPFVPTVYASGVRLCVDSRLSRFKDFSFRHLRLIWILKPWRSLSFGSSHCFNVRMVSMPRCRYVFRIWVIQIFISFIQVLIYWYSKIHMYSDIELLHLNIKIFKKIRYSKIQILIHWYSKILIFKTSLIQIFKTSDIHLFRYIQILYSDTNIQIFKIFTSSH